MLNIITTILLWLLFLHMIHTTLSDFATDEMLFVLLAKERAKYRKRNSTAKSHKLDKSCDINSLTNRQKLSRMMPPRSKWVRPKKRKNLGKGALALRKLTEKALLLTYRRDKELHLQFDYQQEFQAFASRIRARIQSADLSFNSPVLMPMYKDQAVVGGKTIVTCRPLTVYMDLEDKIILGLASRYLTKYLDKYLHPNILSYRKARLLDDGKFRPSDFNDGIRHIRKYLDEHYSEDIYAADCDIKKFYDVFDHQVIRDCFDRILDRAQMSSEAQAQVRQVLEAYLASYNFYDDALQVAKTEPTVFSKIQSKLHDREGQNEYVLGWVDELRQQPVEAQRQRGVSQGGALSLVIANVVLNDVDQPIVSTPDPDRLFIRYCDDMILLHTDRDKCQALMESYTRSLVAHRLYYHDFKPYIDRKSFWHVKSHQPYLWGDGEVGCSNRYIGFLGYELSRDGRMRLRKSNIESLKERFSHQEIIHRRHLESYTPAEAEALTKKAIERILDSPSVYTAFNQQQFQHGSQHKYLLQLRDKCVNRLKLSSCYGRKSTGMSTVYSGKSSNDT